MQPGRARILSVMPDTLAGGASLRTPMSVEEYLALSDAKHTEYFDGVCVVNPPTRQHERVVRIVGDAVKAVCPESHEVLTGWGWLTPAGVLGARPFPHAQRSCRALCSGPRSHRLPKPLTNPAALAEALSHSTSVAGATNCELYSSA